MVPEHRFHTIWKDQQFFSPKHKQRWQGMSFLSWNDLVSAEIMSPENKITVAKKSVWWPATVFKISIDIDWNSWTELPQGLLIWQLNPQERNCHCFQAQYQNLLYCKTSRHKLSDFVFCFCGNWQEHRAYQSWSGTEGILLKASYKNVLIDFHQRRCREAAVIKTLTENKQLFPCTRISTLPFRLTAGMLVSTQFNQGQ